MRLASGLVPNATNKPSNALLDIAVAQVHPLDLPKQWRRVSIFEENREDHRATFAMHLPVQGNLKF
jgi:hypothetical protein